MTQEEIIKEIQQESSALQTDFIMNLIKLCEKYEVKKTEFIRDTTKELYQLAVKSNFDQLKSE